jgi:beta-lactamase regulating signal transducer with metallopeptidase domain
MNALLAILNSFWQAAALAGAVWLALRFARGTNAATRHALWWAVLAVVVLLPFIPAIRPPAPAHEPAAVALFAEIENAIPIGPREPVAAADPAPRVALQLPDAKFLSAFFTFWAIACFLQFARTAWSYRFLRALECDARPAPPDMRRNFDAWMLSCQVRRPARLLISNRIASPIAIGFRNPAVILPETLLAKFEEPDLDHVLLHELAHLTRRDDWTNLAARLASGILAFHPVAQWILRRIDREREMACDDWVVAMTGAARPYATSLTRLFELCRGRDRVLLASGMATRASQLGERIEMLLRSRRQFLAKASVTKVSFACLALIAAGLAFSQTPRFLAIAQDAPPAPQAPEAPPAPEAAPTPETPHTPDAPPSPEASPAPPPPPQPPAPRQGGFLAGLVAAGYGDLQVDEIIHLKNSGVDAQYLVRMSQAGWGRISPGDLVELRNQGVGPEYASAARDAGFKALTLKDVIHLRQSGVSMDDIRRIHVLGYGPFTVTEAIEMHNQGVRADLFQSFQEAGWKSLGAREAIEARQVGIHAGTLREARQYGSSLTLKQIIRLKQAGVI